MIRELPWKAIQPFPNWFAYCKRNVGEVVVGETCNRPSLQKLQRIAAGIRRGVLEMCIAQGGGYLSQACSSAEIFAALYGRILRLGDSLGPLTPAPFAGSPGSGRTPVNGGVYNGNKDVERDRFILSPSHYAQTLYAALVAVGRLSAEALRDFNADGSTLEMIGAEHSPGIEVSGGSFGQALAQAAGIACARRAKGESGAVWVFMSDGEFQEGQTWETLLAAAFHGLDNLRVIVDVNGQQVDGRMADVMNVEPLHAKIAAFGWEVETVDGHDFSALLEACSAPRNGRPALILAYTQPNHGLEPLARRGASLHYIRLSVGEGESLSKHLLDSLCCD